MPNKKPGRNRRWSWWVRGLAGGLVAFFVLAGAVAVFVWRSDVAWDRAIADLRDAGEPLTFVALESMRAVVDDAENGALVLLPHFDALREVHGGISTIKFVGDGHRALFEDGVSRTDVESLRSLLAQHEPLTDALAALAQRPRGRLPFVALGEGPPQLTSRVIPFRSAARLLSGRASLSLIDGDTGGAVDAVTCQMNLAAILDEEPMLLTRLAQIACLASCRNMVEDVLRADTLTVDQVDQLQAVAERVTRQDTMRWALRGERLLVAHAVGRGQPGDLPPTEAIVPGDPGLVGRLLWSRSGLDALNILSELIACADDPALLRAKAESCADRCEDPGSLDSLLMGGIAESCTMSAKLHMHWQCARAALAAEKYRMDVGTFPESVEALVPGYLEAVPEDIFGQGAIRSALTERGLVLYSVGPDGVDNGGEVAPVTAMQHPRDVGFTLVIADLRGVRIVD